MWTGARGGLAGEPTLQTQFGAFFPPSVAASVDTRPLVILFGRTDLSQFEWPFRGCPRPWSPTTHRRNRDQNVNEDAMEHERTTTSKWSP